MNSIIKSVAALVGRREVSQLESDISTYTTESDLRELHEILSRYSAQETAEVRRVVRSSVLV